MTCRCTPELWQLELLTQVRIRLLPCALQVSEAAAFACDPAKETQETIFQRAGWQVLVIHSQFCHLRDRSARIHILLIRALKLTQLGPLRADSTRCTQDMYHAAVHLTAWFQEFFCVLCSVPVKRCTSPVDSQPWASWPSDCCLGGPLGDPRSAVVCLWSYGPHTPPENIKSITLFKGIVHPKWVTKQLLTFKVFAFQPTFKISSLVFNRRKTEEGLEQSEGEWMTEFYFLGTIPLSVKQDYFDLLNKSLMNADNTKFTPQSIQKQWTSVWKSQSRHLTLQTCIAKHT